MIIKIASIMRRKFIVKKVLKVKEILSLLCEVEGVPNLN
jgi:hypothetical protein